MKAEKSNEPRVPSTVAPKSTTSEIENDELASDSECDDNHKIVEESPDGRWQKQKEMVSQRDIPGIDTAYLAIDTEEGVEVVWNEVKFADKCISSSQTEAISLIFSNLIQLDHPNIVKFHSYWLDTQTENKPRAVFITEYMSTGSLKLFLKKTKKTKQTLSKNSWKRWCIQLLSALDYLHSCEPPIIYGILTSDTIFIQNNGLVKIGSIAPDLVQNHLKTVRDWLKVMNHFIAPEFSNSDCKSAITTAVDIYSFGMVALEMMNLELGGNGDNMAVTTEQINNAINSLQPTQQDFIKLCLKENPAERPTARQLLFHPAIFEVYSLKLLSAHAIVNMRDKAALAETGISSRHDIECDQRLADLAMVDRMQASFSPDHVLFEIAHKDGRESTYFRIKDFPKLEIGNLLEDVSNGHYPLTAYKRQRPRMICLSLKAQNPVMYSSLNKADETETENYPPETKRIHHFQSCKFEVIDSKLRISLQFDLIDKGKQEHLRRNLCADISPDETPNSWVLELIRLGFISEEDKDLVENSISQSFQNYKASTVNGSHN